MKRSLIISAAALVLIAGCSKPTETIIPTDMSTWDKELAPAIKKLSEEDRKLLGTYLARMKISESLTKKGMPIGTTIGDAIQSEKDWQLELEKKAAEAQALKERMQREQQAARAAINNAVTVTLIAKRELPKNYDLHRFSERQLFIIGVENKSDKEIVGVSGEIVFIDVFDKEVGGVNFGISERIKPGGTHRWEGGRDYNQFLDNHKAVWNLEEGKYTTRFVPESVVYSDGTKLIAPKI